MNTQNLPPSDDHDPDETPLQLPPITQKTVPRFKVVRPGSQHTQYNIRNSDFTSNLEFTIFPKDVHHGKSLYNIRPDAHNITPQKIKLEILSPPSGGQTNPKRKIERPFDPKLPNQTNDPKKEALEEMISDEKDVRLYKIWPGNNRFFLNGYLMTGPKSDWISNSLTWGLISVFSIVFFAAVFRFLTEDIIFLFPLISIYLFIATVTFLLLTSFTDPGIIPRRAIWELNGEVPYPFNGGFKKKTGENNDSPSHQSSRLEMSRGRFVYKGETFSLCTTCNIYRPPKANHCNFCGNCVEVHGHHSHFLNNCIGKRNYRFFVGFIMSVILLGFCYTTSFLIILVTAVGSEEDPSTIFQNTTVTIIVIIIFGVPVIAMIGAIVALGFLNFGSKAKKAMTTSKLETTDTLSGEEEPKVNRVDWVKTRTSYVRQRQILNQSQLIKYQKNLAQEKSVLSKEI